MNNVTIYTHCQKQNKTKQNKTKQKKTNPQIMLYDRLIFRTFPGYNHDHDQRLLRLSDYVRDN